MPRQLHFASDCRVYRSSQGVPTLVAYARDGSLYTVVVLRGSRYWVMSLYFAQILDLVPVDSVPVDVQLRVKKTLAETVDAWRFEIYEGLKKAPAVSHEWRSR